MRAWGLIALLAAPLAQAQGNDSDLDAMRQALTEACKLAPDHRLAANDKLDAVAETYASGQSLNNAITAQSYRASTVLALTLNGKASEPQNTQHRAAQELRWQCDELRAEPPNEIGLYRSGQRLTAVLAKSRPVPNISSAERVRDVMLAYVNEARSRGRNCGEHRFRAAPAVTLSGTLAKAAALHALQMAETGDFNHVGPDGSTPADRLVQVGYEWSASGENLALGFHEAHEVVEGWLESPGHCANIMDPRFTEMGIAWVTVDGPKPRTYWVQTFGKPSSVSRVSSKH